MGIGRHRSLKQDCEFGIAQIVEIAIRALSPAVNDTFTGVACVDWVADALLIVADVSLSDGCWYDRAGKMRVRVPPLRFERLVKTAFDQIRQAAAENPAVLIRILDTIRRMTPRMPAEDAAAGLDGSGGRGSGGGLDEAPGQTGSGRCRGRMGKSGLLPWRPR